MVSPKRLMDGEGVGEAAHPWRARVERSPSVSGPPEQEVSWKDVIPLIDVSIKVVELITAIQVLDADNWYSAVRPLRGFKCCSVREVSNGL